MMSLFARCCKQLAGIGSGAPPLHHRFSAIRWHHPPLYEAKVGIPEFLKGVGNGVEAHAVKLETEIGDFDKLLITRTLRLKKLGIPCKHRKLILKYTHKFRLGLWRPRAESRKLSS